MQKPSWYILSAKGQEAADWEKIHANGLDLAAEGKKELSNRQGSLRSNKEETGEETQEK